MKPCKTNPTTRIAQPRLVAVWVVLASVENRKETKEVIAVAKVKNKIKVTGGSAKTKKSNKKAAPNAMSKKVKIALKAIVVIHQLAHQAESERPISFIPSLSFFSFSLAILNKKTKLVMVGTKKNKRGAKSWKVAVGNPLSMKTNGTSLTWTSKTGSLMLPVSEIIARSMAPF